MNLTSPSDDDADAASISRTDLQVRGWVLLLLDALAQVGLTPISKRRFHRLAYLANTLSPVYSLRPADERIVKYRRGPYYPDLQWHLDRLAGENFLNISNVVHESDEHGPWMEADYALNRNATAVLASLNRLTKTKAGGEFLLEVAAAYARQNDELLDDLSLEDLTYANEKYGMGAVINFRRYRDNLSARAAGTFKGFAQLPSAISFSDQIHLYIEYIEEKRERAAG